MPINTVFVFAGREKGNKPPGNAKQATVTTTT